MSDMFQLVTVKADTPLERGIQYGSQAKDKIQAGVENYRKYFEQKQGYTWQETKDYAAAYIPLIEKMMPEILEEAKGIAEGAGISLKELMVLNTRYELTQYPSRPAECTTAAVLPEASANGGTYLIKNWDYRPGVLDKIVLVHLEDEYGTRIIGLTEAGQLIREGFNSNGVGLCNNMIHSIYDIAGTGIPVTFLRRRVLASRNFEEAYGWLVHSKRCVSNNMLLVDGRFGRAVDLEAYPGGHDCIWPRDGIVTHANHFVVNPDIDALKMRPKNRDNRLEFLLRRKRGQIDVPYIEECMKDHEYYPKAICNHAFDPNGDPMEGLMTVASLIADFKNNIAYVCKGNPCEGTYHTYPL